MGAMIQYFLQLKDIYSKEQNDEKCWAEEWGNKEQTKEKNYATCKEFHRIVITALSTVDRSLYTK